MTIKKSKITKWLESASPSFFAFYATFFSFMTYFCMYAFRKPFSVGTFEGATHWPWPPNIQLKIFFILAQVAGYTVSKFWGIKFVSEINRSKRSITLISLIGVAQLALVGFALVPNSIKPIFLFLNGLPLGMVWGLVFSYLEGRFLSDILGAGLSASFIVASGVVKSLGRLVLNYGISEEWMPAAVGLIFFPFFSLMVYFLDLLPPPGPQEEEQRAKRGVMSVKQRKKFLISFAPGLILLTVLYTLLTAYRDFRDNFAREIWDDIGLGHKAQIFTITEIPVAFFVLVLLGLLYFVKDKKINFYLTFALMGLGTLSIGISSAAFQYGLIGPVAWMILIGLGLYMAYVPYGCILFDSLLAVLSFSGTAGFMIYVADAFGYLGSVGLMLYRNFGDAQLPWKDFFLKYSYICSFTCTAFFILAFFYFYSVVNQKFKVETKNRLSNSSQEPAIS